MDVKDAGLGEAENDDGRVDRDETEDEDWTLWMRDKNGKITPPPPPPPLPLPPTGYDISTPAPKPALVRRTLIRKPKARKRVEFKSPCVSPPKGQTRTLSGELHRQRGEKEGEEEEEEKEEEDNENDNDKNADHHEPQNPHSTRSKTRLTTRKETGSDLTTSDPQNHIQTTSAPPAHRDGIRMLLQGIPIFVQNPFDESELAHLHQEITSRIPPRTHLRTATAASKRTSARMTPLKRGQNRRRRCRLRPSSLVGRAGKQLAGLPIAPSGPRFLNSASGGGPVGEVEIYAMERWERELFDRMWEGVGVVCLHGHGGSDKGGKMPPCGNLDDNEVVEVEGEELNSAGYPKTPSYTSSSPHKWATASTSTKLQTIRKKLAFTSLRIMQIGRRARRIESFGERMKALVEQQGVELVENSATRTKCEGIAEVVAILTERARRFRDVRMGWEELEMCVMDGDSVLERDLLRRLCVAWRGGEG
jgi:hypothetical protein